MRGLLCVNRDVRRRRRSSGRGVRCRARRLRRGGGARLAVGARSGASAFGLAGDPGDGRQRERLLGLERHDRLRRDPDRRLLAGPRVADGAGLVGQADRRYAAARALGRLRPAATSAWTAQAVDWALDWRAGLSGKPPSGFCWRSEEARGAPDRLARARPAATSAWIGALVSSTPDWPPLPREVEAAVVVRLAGEPVGGRGDSAACAAFSARTAKAVVLTRPANAPLALRTAAARRAGRGRRRRASPRRRRRR